VARTLMGRVTRHIDEQRPNLGPTPKARIAVAKSLALYRERPGGEESGDRKETTRRGAGDTAICSKPSTKFYGD